MLLPVLLCAVLVQDAPTKFDVATVRPSNAPAGTGMNNLRDPVQATWTYTPLKVLLTQAYRVQSDTIIGGPAWITTDRWDIIAKTEKPATRMQQWDMLKPLLAERFKLQVHTETRQLPEYELVLAKGGPKLHESTAAGLEAKQPGTRIGRGLIDAHGIPAAEFAGWLRSEVGRPVIDKTGLTGKYDFKVQWVPDESQPNSGGDAPPPDATGPSIFAAIQELGLKLEAIKGPVEVLVIDHVEKPTGN
jgi:uncharacterized protein (TIGR03435 family)